MVRKPIMPVRGMRGELTPLPPFASHLPFSPPWLSQIKLSKSVEKVRGYCIFLGGDTVEVTLEVWGESGSMELGPFSSPRWFSSPAESQYCNLIPISRFING